VSSAVFGGLPALTFFNRKISLDCLGIEGIGFSFNDLYCVDRAFSKACRKAVTVFLRDQARLAVVELDGPFRAGTDALSATVASFFIYLNNIPFHFHYRAPLEKAGDGVSTVRTIFPSPARWILKHFVISASCTAHFALPVACCPPP